MEEDRRTKDVHTMKSRGFMIQEKVIERFLRFLDECGITDETKRFEDLDTLELSLLISNAAFPSDLIRRKANWPEEFIYHYITDHYFPNIFCRKLYHDGSGYSLRSIGDKLVFMPESAEKFIREAKKNPEKAKDAYLCEEELKKIRAITGKPKICFLHEFHSSVKAVTEVFGFEPRDLICVGPGWKNVNPQKYEYTSPLDWNYGELVELISKIPLNPAEAFNVIETMRGAKYKTAKRVLHPDFETSFKKCGYDASYLERYTNAKNSSEISHWIVRNPYAPMHREFLKSLPADKRSLVLLNPSIFEWNGVDIE